MTENQHIKRGKTFVLLAFAILMTFGSNQVGAQQKTDTTKFVKAQVKARKLFRKNKFKTKERSIQIKFLEELLGVDEIFASKMLEKLKQDSITETQKKFVASRKAQVHQIESEHYLKRYRGNLSYTMEINWDDIQHLDIPTDKIRPSGSRSDDYYVYGFHPYWMGRAFYGYNFKQLNRIGYFGYHVDPKTGGDSSSVDFAPAHSWTSTTMVGTAKKYGCGVDLVVSSYGFESNKILFDSGNSTARNNLVANIKKLVLVRGSGVCLDIQQIPNEHRGVYLEFVQALYQALNSDKTEGGPYEINVVFPKQDVQFPFSITEDEWMSIDTCITHCIVTGDDTYQKRSVAEAGSIKLNNLWNLSEIDGAINHYPSCIFTKILLEIPTYESQWVVKEGDTVLNVIQYKDLAITFPNYLDEFKNNLIAKLAYVQQKGLRGISLWGLGYDYGTNDISQIIKNFVEGDRLTKDDKLISYLDSLVSSASVLDPIAEESLTVIPLLDSAELAQLDEEGSLSIADQIANLFGNPIDDNISLTGVSAVPYSSVFDSQKRVVQHIVFICLAILAFFAVCGFLISLMFESGREALLNKEYMFFALALIIVITGVISLYQFGIIQNGALLISIGIILGVVISLLFKWRKSTQNDELRP